MVRLKFTSNVNDTILYLLQHHINLNDIGNT